jgi:hypothetical protein
MGERAMRQAGNLENRDRHRCGAWRAWCGVCLIFLCQALGAQSSTASGGTLIIGKAMEATPINQPPDTLAQLRLRRQRSSQRSFDEANALRQRQLADESGKLLLLARDLSVRLAEADAAMSPRLLREIDAIEVLAHDVQTKMTLTIGIE